MGAADVGGRFKVGDTVGVEGGLYGTIVHVLSSDMQFRYYVKLHRNPRSGLWKSSELYAAVATFGGPVRVQTR